MPAIARFWHAVVVTSGIAFVLITGGVVLNIIKDGVRRTWETLISIDRTLIEIWALSVLILLIWACTL